MAKTSSFINESTAPNYSKLLYKDTSAGIGGQAEVYEIDGFTRLTFESGDEKKTISRKSFLVMKHDFCEHTSEDTRKRILALQGIIGMDMIKGFRLTTAGEDYTLEV